MNPAQMLGPGDLAEAQKARDEVDLESEAGVEEENRSRLDLLSIKYAERPRFHLTLCDWIAEDKDGSRIKLMAERLLIGLPLVCSQIAEDVASEQYVPVTADDLKRERFEARDPDDYCDSEAWYRR